MILDGLLYFTGSSKGGSGVPVLGPQSDRPTTGTQVSTNVLDLGVGLTNQPAVPSFAAGGGARDIGIGDDPAMKILVIVTVALTGGTSLQVNLQGAPDNGSGAAGAFTTMYTSPVYVEATLIQGARLADIDMPRPVAGQPLPRFLQLQYISVGTHAAGELQGTLVLDRHDLPEQANAVLGGYPAGVVVAN